MLPPSCWYTCCMRSAFHLGVSLILAFSAAALGSLATGTAIDTWYNSLVKPSFNPPNWIFGPVWTFLFAAMAIAAWRVYEKRFTDVRVTSALNMYLIQLALNVMWSLLFFGMRAPQLALIEIVIFLISIIFTARAFYRIDTLAGVLFIPYAAWVSFATFLNYTIVMLNGF